MSTIQNSSTLELFEIYKDSSKLQKLIFIDVIKDLLRLATNKHLKKTPEMVFIQPMLDEMQQEINSSDKETQEAFLKIMNDSIYPLNLWEAIVTFWYQKDRIHFNDDIREYFKWIWDHEEKEIWNLRKMIIQNLIAYWLIKRADIRETPLSKAFQKYENEVIIKDENGIIENFKTEDIFDKDSESYKLITQTYSESELEKSLHDLFKIEFENFIFNINDLEALLETITGEKILKKTKYDFNTNKLWYWNKSIDFKKWMLPVQILEVIFKDDDISIWITYEEIYKTVEEVSELWKNYYNSWLESYRTCVKWINERVRKAFPEIQLFLESRKGALYRTK